MNKDYLGLDTKEHQPNILPGAHTNGRPLGGGRGGNLPKTKNYIYTSKRDGITRINGIPIILGDDQDISSGTIVLNGVRVTIANLTKPKNNYGRKKTKLLSALKASKEFEQNLNKKKTESDTSKNSEQSIEPKNDSQLSSSFLRTQTGSRIGEGSKPLDEVSTLTPKKPTRRGRRSKIMIPSVERKDIYSEDGMYYDFVSYFFFFFT